MYLEIPCPLVKTDRFVLISSWELETGFNTSRFCRFDSNLGNEIARKFRSLQV